jgi:multidrug efflux system membrane fusion protein
MWKRIGRALALCVACLLTACAEPAPTPEILRPVRTALVEKSGGTRTRNFSGVARAGLETQLSFRVTGTIDRLDVRVGEAVEAGQLLARLETKDFEIAVQQTEADLAQARANARNAESNLDRIRGLWENKNASENDLDSARAGAESERAQVESFQNVLERARRQLGYTRLIAPVDGAIAQVPVEVNENVSQGQMVVRLTSGSRPEIEVAMPGVLIAQVHEGDGVRVRFDALPGQVFDAVITEVGVASVRTATTFPVTARLVLDNAGIRSGMAAQVAFSFSSAEQEGAIFLPAVAVGEDRDGRFVFVLEDSGDAGVGVVHRRAVKIEADFTPDGIHVVSGVREGESVVTAGVRRLLDGQRVKTAP